MLDLSGSALWVSGVVAGRTLPMLLLTPFAGALADSHDRRRILLAAHGGMLAIAAAMSSLTQLGWISPPILLALIILLGFATGFNMPAWHAFVPDVVPSSLVPSAVVLQTVAGSVAAAIGPPIGGVLLVATSPATVFAVNGLTYLPVIGVLMIVRVGSLSEHSPTLFRPIKAFVASVQEARTVGLGIWFGAAACFGASAGTLGAMLAPLTHEIRGAGFYGFLLGVSGAGTIVGAWLRRRLRSPSSARVVCIAIGGQALSAVLLAVPSAVLMTLAMLSNGLFGLIGVGAVETRVQLAAARTMRGRWMSTYMMAFLGAAATCATAAGVTARLFGARAAVDVLAIVPAFAGAFLATRGIRDPGDEVVSAGPPL